MKQWKVFYEGSLWGHRKRDHAGRELRIHRTFLWGGREWYVPAVYVCARGLVMDLCVSAEAEAMKAFVEKWLPYEKQRDIPEEVREEMERERPLRMDLRAELHCNGRLLREAHASGSGWVPESCAWEGYQNEDAACRFVSHYGLDREKAWGFRRVMFPWDTKRGQREISSLTVKLQEHPVTFSGPCFESQEGKVTFQHPFSGKEYTLTVLEKKEDALPESAFQREDMEYPRKCVALRYTVDPPHAGVQVRWRGKGDRPREKAPSPHGPRASNSAGVVILRRDGDAPTAVSALYFTLPEKRQWRIVVQEKTVNDEEFLLIEDKK